MSERKSIYRLIEGLRSVGLYDPFTQAKLDVLGAREGASSEITQKERTVVQEAFGEYIQRIQRDGTIRFSSLAATESAAGPSSKTYNVTEFLGFGNMGPVYSVTRNSKPYALKMYSAKRLRQLLQIHGKFGLGGILQDLEPLEGSARLNDLGRRVLAKKPMGVYGRSRRMVKVHDIGVEPDCMYVVMDLLAVDPISKASPGVMGAGVHDIVSWGVDCAVALCNLHVEEGRLHLNIRPEAFIRHLTSQDSRLPKYHFFHYPKKYYRCADSPCVTTEFIMVDHLDNSVDISDRGPKGLGTVGSWPFIPPEAIFQLLKIIRVHYEIYVEKRRPVDETLTIKITRTQMDDVWALGLTLYQFLTGGKNPFGQPKSLADMVNSVLLTKFDFTPIDPVFRDLISSMLEKDPRNRFQRILEGCPDKVKSRKVLAEAILFKLEKIALEHQSS